MYAESKDIEIILRYVLLEKIIIADRQFFTISVYLQVNFNSTVSFLKSLT